MVTSHHIFVEKHHHLSMKMYLQFQPPWTGERRVLLQELRTKANVVSQMLPLSYANNSKIIGYTNSKILSDIEMQDVAGRFQL